MGFLLSISSTADGVTATVKDDQHYLVWARWTETSRARALAAAAERGWVLSSTGDSGGAAGDGANGGGDVVVRPQSSRAMLNVIAEHRRASHQLYSAWDRVLREFVVANPERDQPGYVPVAEIAERVGLTRDRVFQIRRADGRT